MILQNNNLLLPRSETTDRTNNDENVSRRIRQRQKKGNVRFNNCVAVVEIPTHRIYSFDERIACWYTRTDFYAFKKARRADMHINDLGLKVLKALGMVPPQYDKQLSSNNTKELLDASMRVLAARRLAEQRLAQARWNMPGQDQQLPYPIPDFALNPLYRTKNGNTLPHIPLVLPNSVGSIKSGATAMNEPKSPIARGA